MFSIVLSAPRESFSYTHRWSIPRSFGPIYTRHLLSLCALLTAGNIRGLSIFRYIVLLLYRNISGLRSNIQYSRRSSCIDPVLWFHGGCRLVRVHLSNRLRFTSWECPRCTSSWVLPPTLPIPHFGYLVRIQLISPILRKLLTNKKTRLTQKRVLKYSRNIDHQHLQFPNRYKVHMLNTNSTRRTRRHKASASVTTPTPYTNEHPPQPREPH